VGALAKKAKGGREEEEQEESRRDLCSAILCGHPNLLENFFGFAAVQPGRTPGRVVESLKLRQSTMVRKTWSLEPRVVK